MTVSGAPDEQPAAKSGPTVAPKPALRPRDAATLVVIDTDGLHPRVLMGRRRADLVFMPGKFVFPGGRVDPADRSIATVDELRPGELELLLSRMKGTPSPERARALALAAVRETYEEAGLIIGATDPAAAAARSAPSWQPFLAHGVRPRLSPLSLFARAITPPGRQRRYDTRFFTVEAREIAVRVDPPDGELQSLDWFTLDEARRLELPSITRAVIEDLADRLVDGTGGRALPVPFYYFKNGSFHRDLIAGGAA